MAGGTLKYGGVDGPNGGNGDGSGGSYEDFFPEDVEGGANLKPTLLPHEIVAARGRATELEADLDDTFNPKQIGAIRELIEVRTKVLRATVGTDTEGADKTLLIGAMDRMIGPLKPLITQEVDKGKIQNAERFAGERARLAFEKYTLTNNPDDALEYIESLTDFGTTLVQLQRPDTKALAVKLHQKALKEWKRIESPETPEMHAARVHALQGLAALMGDADFSDSDGQYTANLLRVLSEEKYPIPERAQRELKQGKRNIVLETQEEKKMLVDARYAAFKKYIEEIRGLCHPIGGVPDIKGDISTRAIEAEGYMQIAVAKLELDREKNLFEAVTLFEKAIHLFEEVLQYPFANVGDLVPLYYPKSDAEGLELRVALLKADVAEVLGLIEMCEDPKTAAIVERTRRRIYQCLVNTKLPKKDTARIRVLQVERVNKLNPARSYIRSIQR